MYHFTTVSDPDAFASELIDFQTAAGLSVKGDRARPPLPLPVLQTFMPRLIITFAEVVTSFSEMTYMLVDNERRLMEKRCNLIRFSTVRSRPNSDGW